MKVPEPLRRGAKATQGEFPSMDAAPIPAVSIVLPTYNGARFIRETIDSCLSQTFWNFELIVVIDGSTDNTKEIIQSYSDQRIRVIKTENQGQAMAMNIGFATARGKYLSWTSDDNLYMHDAFDVMVAYLEKHPDIAAVTTDGLVIDEDGRVFSYREFHWQCFLYRREAAAKVGQHRPEAWIVEDVDFAVRLAYLAGPISRISMPYIKYRVHPSMVSARNRLERQRVSVKLNFDYITQGIINQDLRSMFMEILSRSALYRDLDTMDFVLRFAADKKVPFLKDLHKRADILRSPVGWFLNRMRIAFQSKLGALGDRMKLYRHLVRMKFQGRLPLFSPAKFFRLKNPGDK